VNTYPDFLNPSAMRALVVAESTPQPGQGRIIMGSTAGADGLRIHYTDPTRTHPSFIERWPDADAIAAGEHAESACHWREWGEVAGALADDIEEHDARGGYWAVWDAPATFARLASADLETPSCVLDVKLLHRVFHPRWRGARTIETVAGTTEDRGEHFGMVEETYDLLHVALDMVMKWPLQPEVITGWPDLMAYQTGAAKGQFRSLMEWADAQGRPRDRFRPGWPVYESRIPSSSR